MVHLPKILCEAEDRIRDTMLKGQMLSNEFSDANSYMKSNSSAYLIEELCDFIDCSATILF